MRTLLAAVLVFSALPAAADLKIVTRRSFGGRPANSVQVTYFQGKRLRTGYRQAGSRYESILQCDLHRVIVLNPQARLFTTTALGNDGFPLGRRDATPRDAAPPIEYTITTEDTGERATIFGMAAWHVRETVVKTSPQPSAIVKLVTDYWFVDLGVPFGCQGWDTGSRAFFGDSPRFKVKRVGEAKRGFPVLTRSIISSPTGSKENIVEVIELSTQPLDPRLFQIPEGFAPALHVGERVDLETPDTPANRLKAQWKGFWESAAKFIY